MGIGYIARPCGEFVGAAFAAFLKTSAKLKQKELTDYCPDETKTLVTATLDNCKPASDELTFLGRKLTKFYLDRDDYFGTLVAIDGNTKPGKRAICILALKTAAICICSGYNEDGIRAATYSYLALRD